MLQDTAYESLLRSVRRALHGRIGAARRDQFPECCEAEPEVTARHFDLAGDGDEAILFCERAGTQAISRTANAEAIGHLEHAVALLSDQVETSIGSPSSSGFSSPLQAQWEGSERAGWVSPRCTNARAARHRGWVTIVSDVSR